MEQIGDILESMIALRLEELQKFSESMTRPSSSNRTDILFAKKTRKLLRRVRNALAEADIEKAVIGLYTLQNHVGWKGGP